MNFVLPVQTLKNELLPSGLSRPVVCCRVTHRPRYWPTIWANLDGAYLSDSTLKRKLHAIEGLYRCACNVLGDELGLDGVIAKLDFPALETCASAYFAELSNRSIQSGRDTSRQWLDAFSFLKNSVERLALSGGDQRRWTEVQTTLLRFERLYSSLKPFKSSKPVAIRALPAVVVEDLFELFTPGSSKNPFRTQTGQWRNFLLFLLLLHQGLRSGEALSLLSNSVKEGTHPKTGDTIYWVNVNRSEDIEKFDKRADRPSIKTPASNRQIPISSEIGRMVHEYVANWRGKQNHPFLFANSRGTPLSLRYVAMIFEIASARLSRRSVEALESAMHAPTVTAHDLRHTCAVVRMTQLIEVGVDMDVAKERLRAFFGWSFESEMPRHYARAYFESRLDSVWRKKFDAHVEALRDLA